MWQVVQWDLVLLLKKLTFRETWKWKSPKWKRTAELRLYYIIIVWLVYQQLCLNGSKACFSLSVVHCGYCITMLLYSLPRRPFFPASSLWAPQGCHVIYCIYQWFLLHSPSLRYSYIAYLPQNYRCTESSQILKQEDKSWNRSFTFCVL